MKKIFTILAVGLFATTAMYAVRAKQGLFDLVQPDGTTIRVSAAGNQYSHYYLSPDGIPMVAGADGVLRYATLEADGRIVPSAIKANNASERSAAEKVFVASLDKQSVLSAFGKRANEVRASRMNMRAEVSKKASPAKAKAAESIPQLGMGLFTTNYPRTGKVRTLVFLVEYKDVKFKTPNAHDYFSRMLNEDNFSENGGTGSAHQYFLEQSKGKFDVTFDVFGPITLANNRSYYGADYGGIEGNDKAPEEMVTEGARQLASQIDFSKYDYDNDGYVDNIFVIYAGQGQNDGGPAASVWPHSWDIPTAQQPVYNGKRVMSYACSNEWDSDGTPCGIGTVCHEYSHVMGLPDLYDTNYSYSGTPGSWSVMDYGSYNNNGNTPCGYSAYERNSMGWLDPVVVTEATTLSLDAINESNKAALIVTEKSNEFFLFENRQQTGWDKYIPGHGMIIWHIDFNQSVWDQNEPNNNSRHQYIDIVEANSNPSNESGFAWPGTSRKTAFTYSSTPIFQSWANKDLGLPITDIAEKNGVITFNVAGGVIDLATPAAPALTATDEGVLTVRWTAVEHATDYLVDLYSRDASGAKVPFGAYTQHSSGGYTYLTIEGVEGEKDYYATVTAAAGSNRSAASPEGHVLTPAIAIQYITPTALEPEKSADGKVHIDWMPVDGAVKYLITIEVATEAGEETTTYTFDDGQGNLAMPAGWSFNGGTYGASSVGYFGSSAPSLKFQKSEHELVTAVLAHPASKLSYWLRGASPAGASTIYVWGRADQNDQWEQIRSIVLVNEAKTAATFADNISIKDYCQFRVTFSKATGNAALDDLAITGLTTTFGAHPLYTRYDVGNTTSVTIDPETFTVEAVNAAAQASKVRNKAQQYAAAALYVEAVDVDGKISKASNKVQFEMNATTGVAAAVSGTSALAVRVAGNILSVGTAAATKVTVTSVSGATMASALTDADGCAAFELPVGLYIISDTLGGVVKAVIR